MRRSERERILGEWGVREGSARSLAERRALERDLPSGSGHEGRELRRRLRNFRPGVDSYVTSLGGPLPYMLRLRDIEAETAAHEQRLEAAWQELAAECGGDEQAFARRWLELAAAWSFAALNELIERHNRYFPAEARLPMDPRTGDYVLVGGKPYRRDPLDARWLLERFPPLLVRARADAA